MVQFRRSKKVGPFRITSSKRGVGISAGAGPLRIGRGADGRYRRTVRVPGAGVWDTKVIGTGTKAAQGRRRTKSGAATAAAALYPAAPVDVPLFVPAQWAALVQPDETPRALGLQRFYVEWLVWRRTGTVHRLHGVSMRQAEHITAALGADPDQLHRYGVDSAVRTRARGITAAVIAILAGIGCLFFPGGPLITAGIAAVAGYSGVARRRAAAYIAAGGMLPVPVCRPGKERGAPWRSVPSAVRSPPADRHPLHQRGEQLLLAPAAEPVVAEGYRRGDHEPRAHADRVPGSPNRCAPSAVMRM